MPAVEYCGPGRSIAFTGDPKPTFCGADADRAATLGLPVAVASKSIRDILPAPTHDSVGRCDRDVKRGCANPEVAVNAVSRIGSIRRVLSDRFRREPGLKFRADEVLGHDAPGATTPRVPLRCHDGEPQCGLPRRSNGDSERSSHRPRSNRVPSAARPIPGRSLLGHRGRSPHGIRRRQSEPCPASRRASERSPEYRDSICRRSGSVPESRRTGQERPVPSRRSALSAGSRRQQYERSRRGSTRPFRRSKSQSVIDGSPRAGSPRPRLGQAFRHSASTRT